MKEPVVYIEITRANGKKIMSRLIHDVKVVTDTGKFTDTAIIKMPRIKYRDKDITEYIRRDDSVMIDFGYYPHYENIFRGNIVKVGSGTPLEIKCENEAWQLKNIMVPAKYYSSLTLKEFVTEYMSDFTTKVADVNFGEVVIKEEISLSRMFDYFMSNYPVNFFFREGTFYGTLSNTMILANDKQKTIKIKLGWNAPDKQSFKYTLSEDIKLKIVAKTILKDNTPLEYSAGDEDGNTLTFYVPGAKTKNDLKQYAESKLESWKVDKMEGTLNLFGRPRVRKGDIVHLFDDRHQERNNKKFLAEAVTYQVSRKGYRQQVKLGYEIK